MMIDHPSIGHTEQLRQLWKTVFGDDDSFLDLFFAKGFSHQRCLCTLKGDFVTGMLYWFSCSQGSQRLAYIYAVATHPEYRGQGICRSLMEAAHSILAREGYSGALLYPQEEGLRKMYRSMGYHDATTICEGICTAAPYPAQMHAITVEEFSRLRREQLPENSVIQEEAFLPLLEDCFRFYKGADFLLAARAQEDHLFAGELLGNHQRAPEILCALGLPRGQFRYPGEKLPFAMFCPLVPGAAAPAYFGFPLD